MDVGVDGIRKAIGCVTHADKEFEGGVNVEHKLYWFPSVVNIVVGAEVSVAVLWGQGAGIEVTALAILTYTPLGFLGEELGSEVVDKLGYKSKRVGLPLGDCPIIVIVNRTVGFEGLAGFGWLAASDDVDDETFDV